MDRLGSIPERVSHGAYGGTQLAPVSTDVFISIPERVLVFVKHAHQPPPFPQDYHVVQSFDLFNVK